MPSRLFLIEMITRSKGDSVSFVAAKFSGQLPKYPLRKGRHESIYHRSHLSLDGIVSINAKFSNLKFNNLLLLPAWHFIVSHNLDATLNILCRKRLPSAHDLRDLARDGRLADLVVHAGEVPGDLLRLV